MEKNEVIPRPDVFNRLRGSIRDAFNEHGVQIMSPHYMMDPKDPVVPKNQWYAARPRPRKGKHPEEED